jgi:hypothetical protein
MFTNNLREDVPRSRARAITLSDGSVFYLRVHVRSRYHDITHEIASVQGGSKEMCPGNVPLLRPPAIACEFRVVTDTHLELKTSSFPIPVRL